MQSVILDLILYWMGDFPEFDNPYVYVRIPPFFFKHHIEVLRGKACVNLLSNGSEKHIISMCVWWGGE